jgi:hypothetical protein
MNRRMPLLEFIAKVFLPDGYPDSVTAGMPLPFLYLLSLTGVLFSYYLRLLTVSYLFFGFAFL